MMSFGQSFDVYGELCVDGEFASKPELASGTGRPNLFDDGQLRQG